ncbi:hypothetical protein [Sulfurimonas sp.]
MKFLNILAISSFLSITTFLNAESLVCSDIYTTITDQKGLKPFKADGSKGNGKTKITIEFGKKHLYIIGTEKVEAIYLGNGKSNIYFLEKTPSGNFNLYSLFSDNTLVVSKSYDMLGLAKMNVQTIYKCIKK